MSDIGYLRALTKSIPDPATRNAVLQIVEHLSGTLVFGAIDPDKRKATNFQMFHQPSTTGPSTSEFTIAHGMDVVPKIAIPVLDLSQPGAKIVPIEVSRAADSRRIYLKSTSTGALVSWLVE